MDQFSNHLIHETSAYLLQHAHNPVDWYPWGEKALEKARAEDKMILVSIGYAACHWCHVMERESFQDATIAKLMNDHFVCIKVDREERPDIDLIYMTAAQLISGSGGWPLNALALPDGKPFFAATYFPPEKWTQLLGYFINEYKTNRSALDQQAEHLSHGISTIDKVPLHDDPVLFQKEDLELMKEGVLKSIDPQYGGLASNTKFPMPSVWEWLLELYHSTGDKKILDTVLFTLDVMRDSGIYDHIGGGFARYATGRNWHVPHFEKMLYDNAQLISLYSHAFQITKNEAYKHTVYETIGFLTRELSGGTAFYSSLDADSEGEEGKFYVWTKKEIEDILGAEAEAFCDHYGITGSGNWEDGKNIPDRNFSQSSEQEITAAALHDARQQLLEHRNKRIRPALDDKVITSWNAMTADALWRASRAFEEDDFSELASANLSFITRSLWDPEQEVLYRNFQRGKAATPGFLDDYAYLIHALLTQYQSTFDINTLRLSLTLTRTVLQYFTDESNQMFFYNDHRFHELISRPTEVSDNVIPASNSVMAGNLFVLGMLYDDESLRSRSHTMVQNMRKEMMTNPAYHTNWLRLVLKLVFTPAEIAIMGTEWKDELKALQTHFLPDALFLGSDSDEDLPLLQHKFVPDKTMIYVCRNHVCKAPVESAGEALSQLAMLR